MAGLGNLLSWYVAERRRDRTGSLRRAREETAAVGEKSELQAYWDWANSEEGRRETAKRVDQFYVAPSGIPDAIFEGSVGGWKWAFCVSSKSAGAVLSASYDARDAIASATLTHADGRQRQWLLAPSDAFSIGFGDGPFTDEEKLIAALLQSVPQSTWPGRTISKTRTDHEEVRRALYDELHGQQPGG
jgi:hypothetical protein